MTRTAHCQCGSLRATAEGEPDAVVACSCSACQRRTGSVFGVGAYYPRERVSVSGHATEYTRDADSGRRFTSHFCPTCGTHVYWFTERDSTRIGLAVGAFADSEFPAPLRSVFEVHKHAWVDFGEHVECFERGRDSRRLR